MVSYGYTLSSEEHCPADLVRNARTAEDLGFDFASISDHFHPWIGAQGHSGFVWAMLGAVAEATDRLRVGTGVTCPTMRIHPAIIAQAAATTSLLFEGRFFLGLGSGEALNEHVLGDRWPPAPIRLSMLEEAVGLIRALWTGETVDHHGDHFRVEGARLFDVPNPVPPIIVSAFGPASVEIAARVGDGYWGTAPDNEILDAYGSAGGVGPRYGQIDLCWAADREQARTTVRTGWPNAGLSGSLAQDLPTWEHVEWATQDLSEDTIVGPIPCGPDVEPVLRSVRAYLDAGYDHLYLHQIGPDQEGFFRFWESALIPALGDLADRAVDVDPPVA